MGFEFDASEYRHAARAHVEDLRRKEVQGLAQFGPQVVARMRGVAPKRTHRLERSIEWRQLGPKSGGIEIGVDYWEDVEFGTSDTRPQSFARPAWAEAPLIYLRAMSRAFGS